ncbi:tyrosine-protein phosphatase [Aquibacillus rhizosphaerae]|uniref:Tyrosine-protein phosphatase n=1 Tax=Aquibacillus rhizosphaerae TaxID=3051431 RepID=A0ABT7L0L9_9BACI|nr:tyrosine-protein phosphatase [Aquibacillus sp. LR5S19]MDL4839323.1 tyrosine-protein phosphatase [Aquibacillus sp. LR5S19]
MDKIMREIKLEGSFNFRDLGGYQTEDGRRVKHGMLYRSGNLSRLTASDLEIVNQLGIKKICDLRGADEIEKFPDPKFEGIIWHHTPILSDEQMLGQVGDHRDFAETLRNTKPGELLLSLNQNMVSFKQAFQKVFKVLLTEAHTPMLFHCMAGKDRTGGIAALLLYILGVPRQAITEDYLYTNETLEKMTKNFTEIGYNDLSDVDQDVLDALFEARVEYIDAFLDEIEARYENVEVYAKEVLGLADDDIDILKQHLLE